MHEDQGTTDADAQTANDAEDQEWDAALNGFLTDKSAEMPDSKDYDADAGKEELEKGDSEDDSEKDDSKKTDEEGDEEGQNNSERESTEDDTNRSIREQRAAHREIAADEEAMREDVIKTLYPDMDDTLRDADGDPIRSIDDAMKLLDPRTGEPFTEEAAAQFLIAAQGQLSRQNEENRKEAERVAQINIDLRDAADDIREKYGDLLNHKPEGSEATLGQLIMSEYRKTLKTHEGTDVIVEAPVSIKTFFDTVMAPYAQMTSQQKAEQTAQEAAKTEAESKAEKLEKENRRLRTRFDRDDIFSRDSDRDDSMSQEDKEWAQAVKEVYG